jgi:predicted transcriptional regulator
LAAAQETRLIWNVWRIDFVVPHSRQVAVVVPTAPGKGIPFFFFVRVDPAGTITSAIRQRHCYNSARFGGACPECAQRL